MLRIGFIGRTKLLYDTISLFEDMPDFQVAFIWTCKDEDYYDFKPTSFEQKAEKIGAKFISSPNISEFADFVEADVVVSINFINIIPQSFIDKFRYGVVNAHAGDLPRYRGNACPNWAILNQESEIALSFHFMDEGLDSGAIIHKEKFELKNNTYIGEIYEWLSNIVPSGFLKSVQQLISGYKGEEQKGKVLRSFPRKPEDSRLNFNADLYWNYRLIRASSKPFSGAYTYLNNSDTKITIYKADPHLVDYEFLAISGQIMEKNEDEKSFIIAIGNAALKVTDYSIDNQSIEASFRIICKSMRNRLT